MTANNYKRDVCLFLGSLHIGGAEAVAVNLVRGFLKHGLDVDLLLAREAGAFRTDVPQDARVIVFGARHAVGALPGLVHYLRHAKPDAILSSLSHCNLVAIWARALARVATRVVVSEHIVGSAHRTSSLMSAKRLIMNRLLRLFYPWADAIVAVSKGVANDVSHVTGIPRKRIRVIYNPFDIARLTAKSKEPLEHPWFKADAPPVILAVGRLTRQKDFKTLIEAFKLVREKRAARLVIVGVGEASAQLEDLIRRSGQASEIAMPGFVENPYAYMARATVFVLSSAWEGFGNVLVEALTCGCPVVSTDCPSGPAEILEDGKYGHLVPVGDANAMARAILDTLENPLSPAVLRRRAEDFSLDRIVGQYLEVLGISAPVLP
ncbi:glycosyltransferase [Candidatus Bipolaricaulota bacterium]|nr:glycosyltransferase [Candidatus Bipolaricaulota bacterium]